MRILKGILIGLAALFALVLIAALFVDGKVNYSKSVEINAPVDKVWANVSTLRALDSWSPWNEGDPNMEKTWEGEDGQPGSRQCWNGNKEVGSGCQTIISVNPPNKIETRIQFFEPYESEADAAVLLEPSATGTNATWSFASEMPYPWRISKLFMNMGKMLDPDFTKGLNKLKTLSEKP